ncbi:hypothetical protein [Alteraurantiacibacter buctensis]|uniref:Uncharacterized protein n=1 Tax=Alteraurantiacibacter buctensis TaxID=1503981 RepID=A0A844YRH5_9SPHN|nr:hypothetical protein [Alteraurantiacibacter buctensis]MXO70179.1 hypothetical protein [Alteraurantiacibacter buctensis]
MIRALSLAALLLAAPLAAQESPPAEAPAQPQLSLEQRMLLRCSAAFALTANRQGSGEAWALAYPPLAERGSEFFAVATARLADETGIDVPAFAPLLRAEAEGLLAGGALQQIMPVCMTLLPPAQEG